MLNPHNAPEERKSADPPAQCLRCGIGLADAGPAGQSWAQVWDVKISGLVTEWLLPALRCPCFGQVTTAQAPPGAHPGSVSYGPGVNTAAVLLSGYGNVAAERTAHLIRMLLGVPVSPGFVDKAGSRLDDRLPDAGFDAAMRAALAARPALRADEAERLGGAPLLQLLLLHPDAGTQVRIKLVTGNGPAFNGAVFAGSSPHGPSWPASAPASRAPARTAYASVLGLLKYEHLYWHADQSPPSPACGAKLSTTG